MTQDSKLHTEAEDLRKMMLDLCEEVSPLEEARQLVVLPKLTELMDAIANVFRAQTRSLLDMPCLYVQFAKDYRVGDTTVRILGLAHEYGYSDQEVLEKIQFCMTSDIAIKKLDPTSKYIYWDAPIPEGSEYVEDSFTCTQVIYQSVPEQYTHSHILPKFDVQVIDGQWFGTQKEYRP